MLAARTGATCVGTTRTVAAIREHGLTLRDADGVTVAHPEAVERLGHRISLLVIAVKSYDLHAAIDRIAPSALDGATVLPLLNGLEQVETIRTRLARPDVTVLAGSIGSFQAFAPEPGVVVQRTPAPARISVASDRLTADELVEVVAPLRAPGVELLAGSSERDVLWEKAARLAVLAAATVASGLTVGELRADPAWGDRMQAALGEAVAVAAADDVSLDADAQWGIIQAMPASLTTSAARDAAANHPTELDAIGGSVLRAAERLGLEMPALARLLEEAACRVR